MTARRRIRGQAAAVFLGALAINVPVGVTQGAAFASTTAVPKPLVGCWHRHVVTEDALRRMRFLTVVLVVLALAIGGASAGVASSAKTLASYCSPSGDICYGIRTDGARVFLQLTTAARYFDRYTLCVTLLPRSAGGAEHLRRCGAFPLLRQTRSTWGSSVNLARQFIGPLSHPFPLSRGRYQVSWKQVCSSCAPSEQRHSAKGQPLGPSLFFRWPAR